MTFNVAIMFVRSNTDRATDWSLRQWAVGAPDSVAAIEKASAKAAKTIETEVGWAMFGYPVAWPMGSVISR